MDESEAVCAENFQGAHSAQARPFKAEAIVGALDGAQIHPGPPGWVMLGGACSNVLAVQRDASTAPVEEVNYVLYPKEARRLAWDLLAAAREVEQAYGAPAQDQDPELVVNADESGWLPFKDGKGEQLVAFDVRGTNDANGKPARAVLFFPPEALRMLRDDAQELMAQLRRNP